MSLADLIMPGTPELTAAQSPFSMSLADLIPAANAADPCGLHLGAIAGSSSSSAAALERCCAPRGARGGAVITSPALMHDSMFAQLEGKLFAQLEDKTEFGD